VGTRDVFAKLGARSGVDKLHWPENFASADAVAAFLKTVGNDLETPALALAPVIGDVLAALRATNGVQLARMSGSGATCFGLFADAAAAQSAAAKIARGHSSWWVKPAILSKADEA
jgi:4-diphosphocytidyl-2-C-methyl-D-erythritol kinase